MLFIRALPMVSQKNICDFQRHRRALINFLVGSWAVIIGLCYVCHKQSQANKIKKYN
jgi:hypothetical protein